LIDQGKLVNLILGAVIALLPFYIEISFVPMERSGKDFVSILIMLLLFFVMPDKKRDAPIALKAFGFFALFLFVFNRPEVFPLISNEKTLTATLVNQINTISAINEIALINTQSIFILCAISFLVCLYERIDTSTLKHILDGISIGVILQASIAIIAWMGFDIYRFTVLTLNPISKFTQFGDQNSIGFKTFLGNPNILASYLSIGVFSLFRKRWAYFIPLVLVGLILTKSSLGVAVFVISFVLMMTWPEVREVWGLVLAGIILAYFTFITIDPLSMSSGRFDLINSILSRFPFEKSLLGVGPGWLAIQDIRIEKVVISQAHNELLESFLIFGILGPVIYLWIVKKALRANRSPFTWILLASFINSLGHFNLHISVTVFIFITALVACLALGSDKNYDKLEW